MGPHSGNFQTQLLWIACNQGYTPVLDLKVARMGAHTLGTFEKHTHVGPSLPPSGIIEQ
jgi:hypothetical protein